MREFSDFEGKFKGGFQVGIIEGEWFYFAGFEAIGILLIMSSKKIISVLSLIFTYTIFSIFCDLFLATKYA